MIRPDGPFDYFSRNADERSAEERAIDDWLPINSPRTAKWWYSAFHNVTAMVGASVLSFPYAMSKLGWGPGVTLLVISWIITLYTLWQMVQMHEMIPGKRFDRYHELGQHAFGPKLGLWIVVPQQLIVEVGVNIVYMILGGQSLQKFHTVVWNECKEKIKLSYFIMIFASVHFVLSQLPNFHSISGVSLAAAVMSLCLVGISFLVFMQSMCYFYTKSGLMGLSVFLFGRVSSWWWTTKAELWRLSIDDYIKGISTIKYKGYSTIAWGASAKMGVQPNVQYGYKANSTAGTVFAFFSATGNVAFAYAGHNIVLEIQSTMPSTPEKPSKGPMWRGVIGAYIIVALCYFPVALIGYRMFGNQVEENILIFLKKPKWLIAMANMFVVLHLIGAYQIYAMPVFDMMEAVLVKKLRFKPSRYLRFFTRNIYVAFTMFIAMTFPFFNELLGFFGGFAFAPTTYFLPCVIWLSICKPRRFSLSWFTNWICITLGVLLMIIAPIGGLREIIIKASKRL